jgi:hypothetical protein
MFLWVDERNKKIANNNVLGLKNKTQMNLFIVEGGLFLSKWEAQSFFWKEPGKGEKASKKTKMPFVPISPARQHVSQACTHTQSRQPSANMFPPKNPTKITEIFF